jgi:4'-phosphopantetheinyl transferase
VGKLKNSLIPFNWPEQTVRLNGDGYALVLLKLPRTIARTAARINARLALRQIAVGLIGVPSLEIYLIETPRGPIFAGLASDIHISLSYATDRCLIGLCRGHEIGVDIVKIEALPELEALSKLYLPDTEARLIFKLPRAMQAAAFALAWAKLEAGSKCLGLPLEEINPQRELDLIRCQQLTCTQPDGYRIALAINS